MRSGGPVSSPVYDLRGSHRGDHLTIGSVAFHNPHGEQLSVRLRSKIITIRLGVTNNRALLDAISRSLSRRLRSTTADATAGDRPGGEFKEIQRVLRRSAMRRSGRCMGTTRCGLTPSPPAGPPFGGGGVFLALRLWRRVEHQPRRSFSGGGCDNLSARGGVPGRCQPLRPDSARGGPFACAYRAAACPRPPPRWRVKTSDASSPEHRRPQGHNAHPGGRGGGLGRLYDPAGRARPAGSRAGPPAICSCRLGHSDTCVPQDGPQTRRV